MSIGERIRLRRQQLGLTLGELAETSGVSKPYLSQLENNREDNPSLRVLMGVAKALSTTVADILDQDPQASEEAERTALMRAHDELSEGARSQLMDFAAYLRDQAKKEDGR